MPRSKKIRTLIMFLGACAFLLGALAVELGLVRALAGTAFSGFSVVMALLLLGAIAMHADATRSADRAIRLVFEQPAPAMGGTLQATAAFDKPGLDLRELEARLLCYGHDGTTETGKLLRVARATFPVTRTAQGASAKIALEVAPDIAWHGPLEWQLVLRVDAPGVEQVNIFPVEVSGTPRSAPAPARSAAAAGTDWPRLAVYVGANLMPLAGALFLGWRVGDVLFVYWAETAIILAYSLLQAAVAWAGARDVQPPGPGARMAEFALLALGLSAVLGFLGILCYGHLAFISEVFIKGANSQDPRSPERVALDLLAEPGVQVAVSAMVVLHGVALIRAALAGNDGPRTIAVPVERVVATQGFIIVGGAVLHFLGSPAAAMAGFVAVKIGADYWIDRHRHRTAGLPG